MVTIIMKSHKHSILLSIFSFFYLQAATAETLILTESQLATRVRMQNPDIAAARLQIEEARGRMINAGRLDNPSLQVGTSYTTTMPERGIELQFSQRFPVTKRLTWEKKISAAQLEQARWEVREVENQLIGEAWSAMVQVLAVRKHQTLLVEQTKLCAEIAKSIDDLVKKGEATTLEAGQARLESTRLKVEESTLKATEQQYLAKLYPLLGMKLGEELNVSGTLPIIAIPPSESPLQRPAVQVAALATRAAKQSIELEKAKRLDDVSVGFIAAAERTIDMPVGSQNDRIVGLQFSFPLPLWNRNEGPIHAATAQAERHRLEAVALEKNIRLEADAVHGEMTEWAKLAAEIRTTLLAEAVQQCSRTEQAWREGQMTLTDVLRSREQSLEIAVTHLDAWKNFHLARARYNTILGFP